MTTTEKRPRGRPTLPSGHAVERDRPLNVYTPPPMRSHIKAAAESAGLSVSSWMLAAAAEKLAPG